MLRGKMTIQDVARLTGIRDHTLRRLESTGALPQAKRDRLSGNRRVYSPEDVEIIRRHVAELQQEHPCGT